MATAKAKRKGKKVKTEGASVIDRSAHDYKTNVVETKDGTKKRAVDTGDNLAKAMRPLDIEQVKQVAKKNGLTLKDYPNPGMLRMNVGNMLRGLIRKGGKVDVLGKTVASL